MKAPATFCLLAILATFSGCATGGASWKNSQAAVANTWKERNPVWRGVHLLIHNDRQIATLEEQLPRLRAAGVNALILEVGYNLEFKSHPEINSPQAITVAHSHELVLAARTQGIRIIPELNCLGHQSWGKSTGPLLAKHPEFDETPGPDFDNKTSYCRSWCPQNPEVNKVVFDLIDELADAFEADAFHVGMDEVFVIASGRCPRCKGGDPAKLFAKAVNDLHGHVVGNRKLEMFIWGDRLLDAKTMHCGAWESATNGTHRAVELIPKDIVICDWHYEKRTNYPSVPFLLEKGFRVWPASWQPLEAAKAYSQFSREQKNARVVGFLCTVWSRAKIENVAEWPPVAEVLADWKSR